MSKITVSEANSNGDTTTDPINENSKRLLMRDKENEKIIAMLEEQVQDLKDQIAAEKAEKTKLIGLADRLQKQNELLMLPAPITLAFVVVFMILHISHVCCFDITLLRSSRIQS